MSALRIERHNGRRGWTDALRLRVFRLRADVREAEGRSVARPRPDDERDLAREPAVTIRDIRTRVRLWLLGPDRALTRATHRVTQPADRQKALRTWRRAAAIWCATRFEQHAAGGPIESNWKPAMTHGRRVVGLRARADD